MDPVTPESEINTETANTALLKASSKPILDEGDVVNVSPQELQEVIFALLEKAQMLSEVMAKSGDENAMWLAKRLHEVTEEFDCMEAADSYDGISDVGEAIEEGATVFGGDYVPDFGRGEVV